MARRRLTSVGLALVLGVLAALWGLPPGLAARASGTQTQSHQVSRVHLEGGHDVVADQRTVSVSVSRTGGLLDRQRVAVSWTGAHPTTPDLSRTADPRAPAARNRLFPFVVLQCRGVDSPTAPVAQRLGPETCYTQSSGERVVSTVCCDAPGSRFPAWRLDRYASAAQRQSVTGLPSPLPSSCGALGPNPQRWLPFRSPSRTFGYGPDGCLGVAPENSGDDTGTGLPGNAVYAETGSDGSGQVLVDVRTTQSNASLGCTDKVPCALVAVPVEGISCDADATQLPPDQQPSSDSEAAAAANACTSSDTSSQNSNQLTMTGRLWWSPSNWRNRFTFPLQFQPLPGSCDLLGQKDGLDIYGSELLTPVTQQWQGKFCADPHLFPFKHVQTGEPQARNLLGNGTVEAAFTTFGPTTPSRAPVVTAPVALGGFAIGFIADDANREAVHELRLTPRLLAKLLTESYPQDPHVQQVWQDSGGGTTDTTLRSNPRTMLADPEFSALNPRLQGLSGSFLSGASTLAFLSPQSDLVRAVTAYIDADKDARAWLDGQPDPWGMRVNPHYRGISLPVDTWPLLDTFSQEFGDCKDMPPWLPLVAAPATRLAVLGQRLEYGYDAGSVGCVYYDQSREFVAKTGGYQAPGNRFLVGLTSLADAARFTIDVAALRSGSGSSFVSPTAASMASAAGFLHPSPTTAGLWQLDAKAIAQGPGGAYPGLVPVHLQAPASGLPAGDAAKLAALLRYAAGPGQVSGEQPGQLPTGFLPLTTPQARGLAATTLRAAGILAGLPAATGSGRATGRHPGAAAGALPSAGSPAGSPAGAGSSTGVSGASAPGSLPPVSHRLPSRGTPLTGRAGAALVPVGPVTAAGLAQPTSDVSAGALGLLVPGLLVLAAAAATAAALAGRRP